MAAQSAAINLLFGFSSKIFERVAKQPFQKFYWFGFERKVIYLDDALRLLSDCKAMICC
jgi:hypothetical protein